MWPWSWYGWPSMYASPYYGWPGWSPYLGYGAMPYGMPSYGPWMPREQRLEMLKSQARTLSQQLDWVNDQIKELEKSEA